MAASASSSTGNRLSGDRLEECLLGQYFVHRVIKQEPVAESCGHATMRIALESLGSLGAFLGNIPYYTVNREAGYGVETLGWIFFLSNTIAFMALGHDSIRSMVNKYFKALSEEEKQFASDGSSNCCLKMTMITSAIIIGGIAQAPIIYFAGDANQHSFLPAPVMAALASGDAVVTIHSVEMSLDSIVGACRLADFAKELVGIRGEMVGSIHAYRGILEGMGQKDLIQEAKKMEQIGNRGDYDTYLTAITGGEEEEDVEEITRESRFLVSRPSVTDMDQETSSSSSEGEERPGFCRRIWTACTRNFRSKAITGVGVTIAFMHMAVLAMLTEQGMSKISDRLWLNIGAAGIVVGANLYIQLDNIVQSTRGAFAFIGNLFQRKVALGLPGKFYPKTTFALHSIGSFISLFSCGASIRMCDSAFSGINTGLFIFSAIVTSLGTVLLVAPAVFSIIEEDILKTPMRKWSAKKIKRIFKLDAALKEFAYTLSHSPIIEWAKFLRCVNPRDLERFTDKVHTLTESLDRYISDYEEVTGVRRPLLPVNPALLGLPERRSIQGLPLEEAE